jgi:glycine betaine transporter
MTNKIDESNTEQGSFFRKHGLFVISLLVSVFVAIWGVLRPDDLGNTASSLTSSALKALDWFFMAAVTGFVILCAMLAIGPYGKIKLGKDTDKPEFSLPSWMAMLFAAGMGVGLLFWGVSEPVRHFVEPAGLEPETAAAARQAMVLTCFHWGLHAWAVYAVTALVLAYFGFRKGAKYLPGEPLRWSFKGRWVKPVGDVADIVGVLAVALGVAGSLGMGLMQIQSGLHIVTGVSGDSVWVGMAILACLVAAYMISATTGLDKGIRLLSNLNMTLAVLLLFFVLLTGSTVSLFGGFLTGLGDYASSLVGISLRLFPYQNLQEWTHRWTLTFFIFWIAWAPFVGVFIARISRGRTIREFVLGVLLVPTVFSVLWFAVFGGSGIHQELHGAGGMAALVKEDMTVALFTLFDRLPLSNLLSVTAILLIFIFLVTSADSATFVLGMLTSQGNPNPPTKRKVLWGIVLGALGAALLFTGKVESLQAVVVAGAIPFTFVILLQVAALIKELRKEPKPTPERPPGFPKRKKRPGAGRKEKEREKAKERERREKKKEREREREARERKKEKEKERERERERERKERKKKEGRKERDRKKRKVKEEDEERRATSRKPSEKKRKLRKLEEEEDEEDLDTGEEDLDEEDLDTGEEDLDEEDEDLDTDEEDRT